MWIPTGGVWEEESAGQEKTIRSEPGWCQVAQRYLHVAHQRGTR